MAFFGRPSAAAATRLKSLSAKERKRISAGVWPRSMAGSASSTSRVSVRRRCIRSGPGAVERLCNRGFVETFLADDDQAPLARLTRAPRPVKAFLEAAADALHEQACRFAAHFDKALDPQHIVALGDFGEPPQQGVGVADGPDFDNCAVKIVVIMFGLTVVMRGPRQDIVFGGGAEAKQHRGIDPGRAGRQYLDCAGKRCRDLRRDTALFRSAQKVGFVE